MRAALLLLALAGAQASPPAPAPASLAALEWLQGCWSGQSDGRYIDEQWMEPRGGSMLGMSRTVTIGGDMVAYELAVIRSEGSGVVYEARPAGQPAHVFRMTTLSRNVVTFEDPAHDFPQRIGYLRHATGVTAWVEGTANGTSRKIAFEYRRARCPGPAAFSPPVR